MSSVYSAPGSRAGIRQVCREGAGVEGELSVDRAPASRIGGAALPGTAVIAEMKKDGAFQ